MVRLSETPCPWCHRGQVVFHDATEPWIVHEESGEIGRRGPKGRPARFQTSPVAWFSCSECAMTGTLSYLRMMLSGGVQRYLRDVTLQRRTSALREGKSALRHD